MNKYLRKCNKCSVEKELQQFDKSHYKCKQCRQKEHLKKKIEERKPYRDTLKQLCINDGVTEEGFNKHFLPFEKYEIMKELIDLYEFHTNEHIREIDKKCDKLNYENKYFLDVVLCYNVKAGSYYLVHII